MDTLFLKFAIKEFIVKQVTSVCLFIIKSINQAPDSFLSDEFENLSIDYSPDHPDDLNNY